MGDSVEEGMEEGMEDGVKDGARDTVREAAVGAEQRRQRALGDTPAGEGAPAWRRLLSGGSPREALARIIQGDPLGLRGTIASYLREEAYLLDADRVNLRSLARCARYATRYTGRPTLQRWLRSIVRGAVDDLLREEAQASRSAREGLAEEGAIDRAYLELAAPLGLDPGAMLAACAAFNLLPAEDRRAFFGLLIQARTLEELARDARVPATEIACRARRGLLTILSASKTGRQQQALEDQRPKRQAHKKRVPKSESENPREPAE